MQPALQFDVSLCCIQEVMQKITTPRLVLREARWSDVDDFHRLYTDELFMKYMFVDHLHHIEQSQGWMERMIKSSCNGKSDFVITLRTDGDMGQTKQRAVGKIGIWNLSLPSGEIGIMIDPSHQRQGIASEALDAVLDYLWKAVEGLEEITADVDPRNDASLRLLKKYGFRVTGEAKGTFQMEDGEWCNSVYLSLRRSGGSAMASEI